MMRNIFRKTSAAAAPPTAASVDVGTIRQRFNYDWCMDPDNGADQDTYWWWAISIRVDPDEVIAEDDEGSLWLIPFTTDGADTVTFSDPVRVRETFVPVAAQAGTAATEVVARQRQRVLASNLERPEKPAKGTTQAAASAGPDNEEHHMDPEVLQALARQHGLDPETATEADINAAVIAAAAEPTIEPEAEPTVEVTPEPELAAAAAAAGSDPTVLAARVEALERQNADLTARATARENAEAEAAVARRVADVSAACQDGRIRPSDHDTWVERVSDATHGEAHAATLASLASTVPVTERAAATTNGQQAASLGRVLASIPGHNRKERS